MFKNPSLVTRIAIGKLLGFLIGLAGFVLLPVLVPDASDMLRWGVLLWYTTLGALIGMAGVFTYHPVLHLPLPWWFRAPFLGAWMNFVLVLFTFDQMVVLMDSMVFMGGMFTSPFWLVAEGAAVGLLIGGVATALGGEGAETLSELPTAH